jgi:hypothetical protein
MRLLFALLLLTEVLLLAAPFQHFEIRRKSVVQAWSEWKRNPSSETETAWRHEKTRLSHSMAVFDGTVLILIGVNGYGIAIMWKRMRARKRQGI